MAQKPKPIMVTSPIAVVAYGHLHKPDTEGKYADNKFKATFIFEQGSDLSKLEEAARRQAAIDFPKMKPEKVNILIRDGDDNTYSKDAEDGSFKAGDVKAGFEGRQYIVAKTQFQPQLLGPDRLPLPAGIEIRSGDKVKVVLAPFKSDMPMKGTITFRLQAVQLIEKRAGGGHDYSDLFDDEGEGYGSGNDGVPSTGAESGIADDDEIPF